MRIGRNEPCPCGSGKKFKRCCGATDEGVQRFREAAPQGEPVSGWARAHAVWPETRQTLIEHGRSWLGEEAFADAIEDFPFDTDEGLVEAEPPRWVELFLTWQLYDWIPEGQEVTVAEHWLQTSATVGGEEVRRMIQSANGHPLSFYQVQAVDRGRGSVLKNLLADEELFVVDRSLSETVPPWTILFGRFVDFGGITIFDALGYHSLPPHLADAIVADVSEALDRDAPLTLADLRHAGSELVELYDEALYELLERASDRPVLHTTDGELLVPCRASWAIEGGEREEVLLRLGQLGFELDQEGEVPSFRWIRQNGPSDPLPTVHLGTVTVEADEVIVETHSRERQARLVEQVEQALGSLIRLIAKEEHDPSEMFDRGAEGAEDDGSSELPQSLPPEIEQQLMRDFLERHYASWPDIAIPALGGKTPRAAVRSPSGRTQVETLLRDMEFHSHGTQLDGAFDFDVLRKQLGLPTAR